MRKLLFILFVLLLPVLAGAAAPEPPTVEWIQGGWQLTAVREHDRETPLPADLTFVLRLKQTFVWSAEFSAEEEDEEAGGVWSLRDDVLALESDQGTARLLAARQQKKLLLRSESDPDVAMVFQRAKASAAP